MNRINKNLKPCPFCGNPAEIVNATYEERPEWCKGMEWYKIRCVNECCLFLHQGRIFGSKEEAANEWNLRRKANPNFFLERRKKSIIVKTRESEDKEDDQMIGEILSQRIVQNADQNRTDPKGGKRI